MKKLLMLFCVFALCAPTFAAEIAPIDIPDLSAPSNLFSASIDPGAITARDITFTLFTDDYFDVASVEALAPGDTVVIAGEPVTIDTVETDPITGEVRVNSGLEAGGATLAKVVDIYVSTLNDGSISATNRGQMTLPLAETVSLSIYDIDETGSPVGSMTTRDLPAADLGPFLRDYCAASPEEPLPSNATVLIVHNNRIAGLTRYYMP